MYTTASLSLLKSGTKLRMSAISHSQGILQSESYLLPLILVGADESRASTEESRGKGDIELQERNSRPWKATLLNGKKQGTPPPISAGSTSSPNTNRFQHLADDEDPENLTDAGSIRAGDSND